MRKLALDSSPRYHPCVDAPANPERIAVVAFGGNAIIRAGQRGTAAEQMGNLAEIARQVAGMIKADWSVVLAHGNGPQVGNLKLQQEAIESEVPAMPLDVCGAMTQGQIGYLLELALSSEFAHQGIDRPVVAVVTRCLIDPCDQAFSCPDKPIGPFYSEAAAKRLCMEKGWTLIPDAGRGFRRVVPSPAPQEIIEYGAIRVLVRSGAVVVACGGGGVPVVAIEGEGHRGIEAVIDKDFAASLLAGQLGAHTLVLITQVPRVCLDFGTPHQRELSDVTLAEIKCFAAKGHFPAGSMGPKIRAAVEFLRRGGETVVITSPPFALEALRGEAGTRVHRGAV